MWACFCTVFFVNWAWRIGNFACALVLCILWRHTGLKALLLLKMNLPSLFSCHVEDYCLFSLPTAAASYSRKKKELCSPAKTVTAANDKDYCLFHFLSSEDFQLSKYLQPSDCVRLWIHKYRKALLRFSKGMLGFWIKSKTSQNLKSRGFPFLMSKIITFLRGVYKRGIRSMWLSDLQIKMFIQWLNSYSTKIN